MLLLLGRARSLARAQSAPVRRLGHGTSASVLFGQNAVARAFFSAEFCAFRFIKTYLALASGTGLPVAGIARHPIGVQAHGPLEIACVQTGGRTSVTRLRVLARDLVARDARELQARPHPVGDVVVAVAHAAGVHTDPHLAPARLRQRGAPQP
jgi:23S rRNA-/tRNA-specific pseudouridylate synthase